MASPIGNKLAAPASELVISTASPLHGSTQGIQKRHLVGLDALRAVAALSVCLYHATGAMLPKLIVPAAKQLFSRGYLGVDIFFVISGFIIPYSLLGKNHQVAGFFAYLKKRILRINPPAYVSLLLIIGQSFFIDRVINHNTRYTGAFSVGQFINNLLFTIPFTNYSWISNVFWTLAIEFQFYLFIGLLFNFLFTRSITWFVGIYALVVAGSLLPNTQAIGFLHYGALFALGGLALLWQQRRITPVVYILALLVFGSMVFWQLGLYAALVGISTAIAINSFTFRIPGLSFLGKMSYSFYLLHGLISTTAEFFLVKLVLPTTDIRKLFLTLACILLAIGGSFVFYQLVERPFMRLAAQNRR